MKTTKMSFKGIDDVLSRDEMKKIMAGSGVNCRFTVHDPQGSFQISGSCGSSSVSACLGYAGQTSSQLAISSGYRVDYTCY